MTARTPARTKAGSGVLHFRDLGPLVVDRADEPVPLVGARLVGALTLLLVQAGHVVSPDALAAAMWGEDAGPRSSSTLDSHVWRLRNVLEPGRARGEPATVLLREPGGYRLVAAPEQVDSLRFAVLADDTLRLLSDGQAARALRRCEEALQLWRGRPFGGRRRRAVGPPGRGAARGAPGAGAGTAHRGHARHRATRSGRSSS